MTVKEIREHLNRILLIARTVASITPTKKDDLAVALVDKIVNNEEIIAGIEELLAKEGA